MKRLAAAFALVLFFACSLAHAAPARPGATRVEATLAPGKIHEECAKMPKGEKRNYHWKASGPVDFNIHYHRGKDVFYPVKREAMRGDGGSFTASSAEEYCWMWSARDREVKVEGAIQIGDGPR